MPPSLQESPTRRTAPFPRGRITIVVAVLAIATAAVLLARPARDDVSRDHVLSVTLTGSLAKLAQAESAYFAMHGRFSADRDSLSAVLPFLSDTAVELRFDRADSIAWSVVARPRGARFTCALTGSAGRPVPSFAEVHARCVRP
jgi:hypothetical protein